MNAAMIAAILGIVETAATELPKLIADAKQAGELTDDQAAAFEQRMTAAFASKAWQTDAQLRTGNNPAGQ